MTAKNSVLSPFLVFGLVWLGLRPKPVGLDSSTTRRANFMSEESLCTRLSERVHALIVLKGFKLSTQSGASDTVYVSVAMAVSWQLDHVQIVVGQHTRLTEGMSTLSVNNVASQKNGGDDVYEANRKEKD